MGETILVMRISIWRLNARLAIQANGSKKMNEELLITNVKESSHACSISTLYKFSEQHT